MKVLIVEPGKYPREADIEHTLEAEQAVVGGTIEAVYPWRDSACIVCNDNGIAENLPLNRMLGDYDIIHGTFFVCGLTSNDFTDLTPKQMKHYEEIVCLFKTLEIVRNVSYYAFGSRAVILP